MTSLRLFLILTFVASLSAHATIPETPPTPDKCKKTFGDLFLKNPLFRGLQSKGNTSNSPTRPLIGRVAGLPHPAIKVDNRVRANRLLQKLYKTKVEEFFSPHNLERAEVNELHMPDIKMDPFEAELDRFVRYFEASSRWKRMVRASPDNPGFVNWVSMHKRELFSREQIQYMIKEGYNFEKFRAKTLALYENEKGSVPMGRFEKASSMITRNPLMQDLMNGSGHAGLKTVTFLGGTFWMLNVMGPGQKWYSAYMAPVFDPAEFWFKKKGSQDLREAGRSAQDFFTYIGTLSKEEATVHRTKLRGLLEDLRQAKSLSPKEFDTEIKVRYKKLYYDTLQALYAYLPANERDGRAALFEQTVRNPALFASLVATLKTESNTLTLLYENLKDKRPALVARGRELAKSLLTKKEGTKEKIEFDDISNELAFLDSYHDQIKFKRRQIASAMVMWQMNDEQYPELTAPKDEVGKPILTDYDTVRNWLGYDEYQKDFADEINELIGLLDNYLVKAEKDKSKK